MATASEKEKSLFIEALAIESVDERQAFLRRACGGDASLLQAVSDLLAAHGDAGDFLQGEASPPPPTQQGNQTPGLAEGLGTVIGRYKLLQVIGEGGFGVVYSAEQRQPVKRRVALKIIKLGMDTKQVVARFEAERQALAMMDHSNIAKVLDGGATDTGRPYFVMELVKGIPLIEFCDERKLTTEERLHLFVQICQAIHHAHQKGVIHRDLKPSNILVTLHEDQPVPKVIDFGIAKATQQELTEKTVFTRYQDFMGTPAYMSPEQAQFSGLDIDTRTDIYSLGVLLYELLTGRTPFASKELLEQGYDSMRRIIREKDPPRPSTQLGNLPAESLSTVASQRRTNAQKLRQTVEGDLDWIVLKALEKDRSRRYESALGLAQDITRFLEDEPVSAVAPSVRYRFKKFARRNRKTLVASVALACSLILGTTVSTVLAYRAIDAKQQLREALEKEFEARVKAEDAEQAARDAQKQARQEAAVAEAVNRFLNEDLIGYANPINEPDRDLRLRTLLDRASAAIERRFADQPVVESAIRQTLAQAYLNLGEYLRAEHHAERALTLRSQTLPEDSPDRVQSRILLAAAKLQQGRYREVAPELETLLQFARETFTNQHELTIETAYWLSKAYGQISRADDGEALMVEFLPISQTILPADHWLAPTIVNERGYYHVAYRRMAEAEAFSLRWLAHYRSAFGREHPYAIMLMHNLASAQIYQGKHEEAKAVYEETLELMEKVLGARHPSRIKTLAESAWYYRFTGQFEPAEKLLQDAYRQAREVLGDSHPDTRRITQWLSSMYTRVDRLPKRRALLHTLLQRDPENPHAREDLAGFLEFESLTPLMPDAETAPTTWRYTTQDPGPGWEDPDFDDSAWQTAPAPFGQAEQPEYRTAWTSRTLWLRRHFEISSQPTGRVVLRVIQDDHSEIFLNGVNALMRQSWTGRKRLLIYATTRAARQLHTGRNLVAIRADNIDLEGFIDVGLYLETIRPGDQNPLPPIP